MKVDLRGRTTLITGAGQGIGRAIAWAFAENGAMVAVNDIGSAGVETAAEINRRGGKAEFYSGDVSDVNAVNKMVQAVEGELGPIEILVNNAGVNLGKERHPIHEFLDSDWQKILRIDLDGFFLCMYRGLKSLFLPLLMTLRACSRLPSEITTLYSLSSTKGFITVRALCRKKNTCFRSVKPRFAVPAMT